MLSPASFAVYIKLVHSLTDGLVYVLSGRRRLAGSTQGPPRLPRSGAISYRGARYLVTSFKAPSSLGPVRVYDLVRG
jgi:hypothetical protein